MEVSAKNILSSVDLDGHRITTMEIDLHRFILPEFNTHRMFSRNFQSSRAIPLKRQRKMVRDNPANPVYWGYNRPGMQATEEMKGVRLFVAKTLWATARHMALSIHYCLDKLGLHKQLTNRLIEPFMFTRGVVTGNNMAFQHFFDLRDHEAAQPEIRALAKEMKKAYDSANVQQLGYGDWHLPYVTSEDKKEYSTQDCIKISVSCCAQVSYRNLDTSLEKAQKIYDMLHLENMQSFDPTNPPHSVPCEHQAQAGLMVCKSQSGNLKGNWIQLRKSLGG